MDKSRTELLIGSEGLEKIASKHITIVGCGGVGGYTAIMLARAGVENFTIIDFDVVSSSNVNRQIIAFEDTIGKRKVEVLQEMMQKINKNIKIEAVFDKLSKENISSLVKDTDLVVDAIDIVEDKKALIIYCKTHNINIVSAMGAGNRCDIPVFEVVDIYKTYNDGLAKVMRKALKAAGVKDLTVVTSFSKPQSISNPVGSISYYPAMCGCTISAWIVNQILESKI
ncbi:MAG: tRNA threonylcarbamoyladenosine dehydratase [Clostridiales bacterium]|nr:tRNA threonylcarbamoyladenosine dehydratase [Clostridiales bacterium]